MASGKETLRLEQQQRLQQRLNPQNVALGRLLEMSVPELEDEIRRELDENPALVQAESAREHEAQDFGESSEELQLADYADDDDVPMYMRRGPQSGGSRDFDPVSILADDEASMIDTLLDRLGTEYSLDDYGMRLARHIIGNFDSKGYLTRRLDDIADDIAISDGIYPSEADMQYVFGLIRSLEPAGIGAVDLRDCLLLQLDRLPPSEARTHARRIIAEHFDAFAKKHFDRLQSLSALDKDKLAEALEAIHELNPKPASGLDSGSASAHLHIVPDITLDYDMTTGKFTLALAGNIPEMAIEETFAADAEPAVVAGANAGTRNKALAFIRRKRDDAEAFIRLVGMRATTLMKIARAIVNIQREFFVSGDKSDIKPMILRDISALTGLDISVISRATAGKYILTPHWVYPLKLFFNERPDADSDVSAHEILKRIDELIAKENNHSPLSDRAICEALQAAGYDIARRTVAKYREKLGYPVARLRRRL